MLLRIFSYEWLEVMSHKCFSSRVESHSHLMPLASPGGHAFLGPPPFCRSMCSSTVSKHCNLPLVFPLCSSYYKGSVVACVGCVVPLSVTTRILLSPEEQSGGVPLQGICCFQQCLLTYFWDRSLTYWRFWPLSDRTPPLASP